MGGVVSYTVVAPDAEADILVQFHNVATLPATEDHPPASGLTQYVSTAGLTLQGIKIDLPTLHQSSIKFPGVAAHEFGHALGINGHSDNPEDLMYTADTTNANVPRTLSVRDINTLKTGYCSLFDPL